MSFHQFFGPSCICHLHDPDTTGTRTSKHEAILNRRTKQQDTKGIWLTNLTYIAVNVQLTRLFTKKNSALIPEEKNECISVTFCCHGCWYTSCWLKAYQEFPAQLKTSGILFILKIRIHVSLHEHLRMCHITLTHANGMKDYSTIF